LYLRGIVSCEVSYSRRTLRTWQMIRYSMRYRTTPKKQANG
jgi:hypothetical protein